LTDEPVDLPGHVVVDLGEPERFEPARGSCAEVSERVPAVDDDRTPALEHSCALGSQALEREAHGSRKMALLVLFLRKCLDELRAIGEQPLQLLEADRAGHL
jgi:hypothetical protein